MTRWIRLLGHGAGQSCVRMVPAERLPDLREVRDIMFSWMRPVAVLTSQFFLSDEKGEMDMPSRINGGRASLQQEVDLDSVYGCPQKGRRAIGTHRLETVSPPQPTIHKLDNGLRDLDRKYELKLCVMMIQSRVETTRTGPELSSYPRLESHNGRTNSDDRWRSRYEDADWFKENPNRAVSRKVSRTGTTCVDYCPYITEISVNI